MKSLIRISTGITLVLASVVFGSHLTSQALGETITDAQVESVRTHCIQIQATLNQLQQSDTLLRYNIGASYRTMSEKLMVPLNQRIAATDFDGSELVRTTAEYNKAYQDFYQKYRTYSNKLEETMEIDCIDEPTLFYTTLDDARQKRKDLYKASNHLVELLKEYKKEVRSFNQKQVKGAEK